MDNFLYKVSEIIYNKYSDSFSDICVVFPNRRAGLYFSDYLAQINTKIIWLPKILSITELFEHTTQLQIADSLSLNFLLYNEYIKKTKINETFDQFYSWGDMLLNDFDEIDKYLVNTDDLFQNISSLKNIENQFNYLTEEQIDLIKSFWKNFENSKLSKHKKDFLNIWDLLKDIYNNFISSLNKKGIAYEGMIYREVVTKINNNEELNIPYKKIIFIGFNALTKCEEIYFNYLKSVGRAEYFWDYDNYYFDNKNHEAGYFIRKYIKKFPSVLQNDEFDNFKRDSKNIEIIDIPSNIGQAKILSHVLSDLKNSNNLDYNKTAIVFTDESLLLPALYSLPKEIEHINITMGFPLSNTPVSGLIEYLVNLQINIRTTNTNDQCKFFYKDVLSILNHQYIKYCYYEDVKNIINKLQKLNKIYVVADDLNANNLFSKIFVKLDNSNKISEYLIDILQELYYQFNKENNNDPDNHNFAQEYIYHTYLLVKQLNEIIKSYAIQLDFQIYYNLLKQIIQTKKLPFVGEPLQGLQLMGILETRCLDFENVIILSLNEGVFPSINPSHSFIPYNLRKGFDLPTIENQNAIYSYSFYRIIQRAKNITLIYNSDTANSNTGEMSRFLYQLKYEAGLKISEKSVNYDLCNTQINEIQINKDNPVIDILNNFTTKSNNKKYLSPTAITTYLDCSFKFYFQYVIGLKEVDSISEDIDYAMFGNILHETMKILYNDIPGKEVTVKVLQDIKKNNQLIENSIKEAFKIQYNNDITGRNILVFEIIKKYISQIIDIDTKIAPFTVFALEMPFDKVIHVKINDEIFSVNIGGKIDRIDIIKDSLRVIDYKTGKVKNTAKDFEDLFSYENEKRSNAVLQTFFYSFILHDDLKNKYKVVPSVYWIRDSYNTDFDYNIILGKETILDFKEYSDEFESGLKSVIEQIFDAKIPFTQCKNDKICRNCPFLNICYKS